MYDTRPTFSLSPISPRTTSDILSSIKVAPVSVAAAFARRVFPVPVVKSKFGGGVVAAEC